MKRIIENIISLIVEHIGAAVLFVVSSILAIFGMGKTGKAKKTNKKAAEIRDAAIARHEVARARTQEILDELGQSQLTLAASLTKFMDIIEKIHNKPTGLASKIAIIKLPEYNPEELKVLSEDAKVAIEGAGGIVAGLGAGCAAFGIGAVAIGIGALGGGIVLCVKGTSLEKKAARNKREAEKIAKEVEKIEEFYNQVSLSAVKLQDALNNISSVYFDHLIRCEELVQYKTDYKTYSRNERKLVQNLIKLAVVAKDICRTSVIEKTEDKDELEKVNSKDIEQTVRAANSLYEEIKKCA